MTGYNNYGARIGWLKGLLDNTREGVRETVAHLYGLVVAQMDLDGFGKAYVELTRSFKDKSLEFQHGIVLALGHGFGRRALLSRNVVQSRVHHRSQGHLTTFLKV